MLNKCVFASIILLEFIYFLLVQLNLILISYVIDCFNFKSSIKKKKKSLPFLKWGVLRVILLSFVNMQRALQQPGT